MPGAEHGTMFVLQASIILVRKTAGNISFHDSAKRRYTPVHIHIRPLGVSHSPLYQAIANTRAPLPVNVKRDPMGVRSVCHLRCPDDVCLMGNDVEARIRAGGRWTRWSVVLVVVCVRRLSMFTFAVGHASGLKEKASVVLLVFAASHNLFSAQQSSSA